MPVAPLPSEADLRAMAASDLKRLAASRLAARPVHILHSRNVVNLQCLLGLIYIRSISTIGFTEKEDFVRAIIESAKL